MYLPTETGWFTATQSDQFLTTKLITMKKLLFLTLAVGFVFASCQKENTTVQPKYITDLSSDDNGAYFVNMNTGEVEPIDLEALSQPRVGSQDKSASSAHGHYTMVPPPPPPGIPAPPSTDVRFNTNSNGQGVQGTTTLTRTYGATPNQSTTTKLDAECLLLDGNVAVYTGVSRSVKGDPAYGFPEGWKVWLYVVDNGNGNGSSPDQYCPITVVNPGGTLPCDLLGPEFIIWSFYPLQDIAPSEEIVVNN